MLPLASTVRLANLCRRLGMYEHEAVDQLEKYGICAPKRVLISSPEHVARAYESLCNGKQGKVVIKAQVLCGGRGKGKFESGLDGGIQVANDAGSAQKLARGMIGSRIFTEQTGRQGQICSKVLMTEFVKHQAELYCSIILDRDSKGPLLIVSSKGGVNIEQVPRTDIHSYSVQCEQGSTRPLSLDLRKLDQLADKLNIERSQRGSFVHFLACIYKAFVRLDASLIEINPFTFTEKGVVCLDSKMTIDDNSHFRRPEIFKKHGLEHLSGPERLAAKHDISYVGMEGNIGCLVNGAGLAMATLDLIKLKGGNPANFLDIGGSATTEQVMTALRIIAEDAKTKTIYVNIFGGIMNCDVIAKGVIKAARQFSRRIPLIVRLRGTACARRIGNNLDAAKQSLARSGIDFSFADNFEESVDLAIQEAQK